MPAPRRPPVRPPQRAARAAPVKLWSWPKPLADMDAGQRNLTLALAISLLLHALLLTIHFTAPGALTRAKDSALDIILVNSKHARKPTQVQAKAQTNMDGGGNTDADVRLTTPLPPSRTQVEADDMVEARQRITELETSAHQLMAQLRSDRAIASERGRNASEPTPDTAHPSGMDLYNRSIAMIQQQGQIDPQLSMRNKHPLRQVLSVRTEAVPEAMYVSAVLDKIERVGTLNYPAAAKGRLSSRLMVTLLIWPDGSLKDIEINRPADEKIFNAAAARIAALSAPFPKVPSEVLGGMEVVAITRWWSFTKEADVRTTDR